MNNNVMQLAEYKMEGGQVLTADTVRKYLVSGGGDVSDQEVLMFIELCKAQGLNPFVRDAYLIKYKSKTGYDSPATTIVGKDVFVKRAYRNPNFEGMKAGIVTVDAQGNMHEREGSLKLPGETLIGGFCEVYVKDMKFPIKSTVSMEEYSKGQSTWKQMPCVMIRKCAMVTALREAFPEDLQGLYDASEMGIDAKLPEKEVKPGMASPKQKTMISALAAQKYLYNFENKKDTSKLEDFCNSNGYNLKELTFDEAEEVLQLLAKYEPKKHEEVFEDKIQEVDFTEVDENITEEQTSLL